MPRTLSILLCLTVCVSCAQVPNEAVQLSDLIGKDLAATRSAHTALVRQYFAGMRGNVNTFVDSTYRPYMLETTMEDLDLVADIQRAAVGEQEFGLDPMELMEIFVEESVRQIEEFRAEMLAPINAQETRLLADLDRSYTALMNANATVTAHLRSITKVHEAQEEVLGQLGIDEDLRERIGGQAANLSGGVNDLLRRAQAADARLDDLPRQLRAIMGANGTSN